MGSGTVLSFSGASFGIGITPGRTYPSSVAHPSLQASKDGSSGPSRRLETGRRAGGQLQGGMAGQLCPVKRALVWQM